MNIKGKKTRNILLKVFYVTAKDFNTFAGVDG